MISTIWKQGGQASADSSVETLKSVQLYRISCPARTWPCHSLYKDLQKPHTVATTSLSFSHSYSLYFVLHFLALISKSSVLPSLSLVYNAVSLNEYTDKPYVHPTDLEIDQPTRLFGDCHVIIDQTCLSFGDLVINCKLLIFFVKL